MAVKNLLLGVLLLQVIALSQTGNGTVAGRILSADGTPASRISVVVTPAETPGQVKLSPVATTDTSGHYQIENIPPGNYVAVVLNPGLPLTYYPGVASPEKAVSLSVKAGSQLAGIDFQVVKQGQVVPPRPQSVQ